VIFSLFSLSLSLLKSEKIFCEVSLETTEEILPFHPTTTTATGSGPNPFAKRSALAYVNETCQSNKCLNGATCEDKQN